MQKIINLRKLDLPRWEFRLQVIAMITSLLIITGSTILPVFGDNSSNIKNTEWKTIPTVGKYLYNEPPKPAQIFNVQYRVVNGTLDSIISGDGSYGIEVSTEKENGLFELKIPLNYPYTNFHNVTNGQTYIVLVNDTDVGHISSPSRLDECFFGFSIPFSGNVRINLGSAQIPEHFPYHGDEVPDRCINDTILSISPLKQLKSGISANDIVCKEGFELIYKSKNDSPACVKPVSVQKLVTWGWAKTLES